MIKSYKISIYGLVQGVGFRPFVYKIATDLNIKGEVFNDSEGVKIFLNCTPKELENFKNKLINKLPPLARIDKLYVEFYDKFYENFTISKSKDCEKIAPILPDFAICEECKKELKDPKNPRFNYPFINCTNCGPRFSIIKKLPYDRQNTTMQKFKMCEFCQKEYENPLNRRYHAEPTSCKKCGISLFLKDKKGKIISQNIKAIDDVCELLKQGKIVAIKGLGGFHLVCDALNENSIKILRIKKNRPSKPFAVMCDDIKMVQKFAFINKEEKNLLTSQIKPIVLLKTKDKFPKILSPNLDKVGIFLANTGLHIMIFERFKNPIIATSANISGEPILYECENLIEKQGEIFDFILDNDREIFSPSDDSVAQIINKKVSYLRTSRGINPRIIHTNFKQKGTFLALGAELKNQFAIYKNGDIFLSPYIGDLKNVETFNRFLKILDIFTQTYNFKFDLVLADLHPNFLHTKYFQKKYKIEKIQHHKAHAMAGIFEAGFLKDEVLAFCFDGTGYGEDGKIWGGEIFEIYKNIFNRIYHFDEFPLIGGENSIKNIKNLSLCIALKYQISNILQNFTQNLIYNFTKLEKKSILTSSIGRIIDAFAYNILKLNEVNFDGETGMKLENLYKKSMDFSYKFLIKGNIIDYKEAFIQSFDDDIKIAATGFLNAIANLVIEISKKHNKKIVLCGGVFQNKTLCEKILSSNDADLNIFIPQTLPTNDSSIAVGQIIYYLQNNN